MSQSGIKTLVYNGGTIIVILHDGSPIIKQISESTFKQIEKLVLEDKASLELIEKIIEPLKEQKAQELQKKVQDTNAEIQSKNALTESLLKKAAESDLFIVENDLIYRRGLSKPINKFLIEAYLSGDYTIEALDNFWRLLSNNPTKSVIEPCFEYLQGQRFIITDEGMIVTYKNVKLKSKGNAKLEEFITSKYLKIKSFKKAPKNYNVYEENGEYTISKEHKNLNCLGNLQDCYNNISSLSENVYTDNHTGKMEIKMNVPVYMPRYECDPDINKNCSKGLHTGNKRFLKQGTYGGHGLLCLVNPYDIVSIPSSHENKMRSCEYLPVGLVSYKDGELIEPDFKQLSINYKGHFVNQINDVFEHLNLETFRFKMLEEITAEDFIKVEKQILTLEERKESLSKRIVNG